MLYDQSVISDFRKRRNAVEFAVFLRNESIDVKSAELCDDEIGVRRSLKLNGDIGFQSRDVRLFHRAAKINRDLPVGLLKVDQPRKNPEVAWAFGHRHTYRPGGIVGPSCAPKNIEGVTLHFHHVADHRSAFVAQRKAALIAQEELAADALFEPIDPAHECGAGDAEFLRGVTKTLVFRTSQKRPQIIP